MRDTFPQGPTAGTAPMIDETFVLAAAKALDLPIAPEHLPGVIANLERIAAIAGPVNEVALDPEDEAAPVWMP